MSETEPQDGVFSSEYVKTLRDEAAGWRKKVRELEASQSQMEIGLEFAKRGVTADPSWLRIPEGMSAAEAVDSFMSTFPTASTTEPEVTPKVAAPQALAPTPGKPNVPGPPAQGQYGGRNLDEIKADPKARANLREQYRALLSEGAPDNYFSQ